MINIKLILSITILPLVLSGCTPTRVFNKVSHMPPTHWQNQPETASPKVNLATWWQGFHDPLLNALITQALGANHDLKIAKERIMEVNAMVAVANSALYPSVDLFSSGGREKKIDRVVGVPGSQGIELIIPTGNAVSSGLTALWEVDLFGGRHLDLEAVLAQALGTEEAFRAVQVVLLAQVATHYLELKGIDKRITIQKRIIDVNREKLRALQAFKQAGLTNTSVVSGQTALLASSEAVLPELSQAKFTLTHRLSMLLGEAPNKLDARLSQLNTELTTMPTLPTLLPATVLEHRPDLRLAKTEVTASAAKLGSARADLFPKILLAASLGYGAIAVGGFSSLSDSIYTLGTGLTAPIFNAGRIQAYISVADSRLKQAAINYEKSFLLAMEDVENSYVAYRTANNQYHQFSEAKIAANTEYKQKNLLYQQGAGDYLSVLDAQKNELSLSDKQSKSDTAISVALVSLYRAFGGGWELNGVN